MRCSTSRSGGSTSRSGGFYIQKHGLLFVSLSDEIYEGMIPGDTARDNDLEVAGGGSVAQAVPRSEPAEAERTEGRRRGDGVGTARLRGLPIEGAPATRQLPFSGIRHNPA